MHFIVNSGSLPATIDRTHLGPPQRLAVAGRNLPSSPTMTVSSSGTGLSSGFALTASVNASTSTTTGSWVSAAPIADFGVADAFQTDLHDGALTDSLPIDVPSGPGGLTPPIQIAYSSANVNETHNIQTPATWVGTGWNLDLGSITWNETDSEDCGIAKSSACPTWGSSWSINDPYGTSSALIPPNVTTETWLNDSPNPMTTSEVVWHTQHESYAKIISFVNPTSNSQFSGQQPVCWRVWLKNGTMEEFGCTPDAVEWYISGTNKYVSGWKLDLITDPSGNQIHLHYANQDMETWNGLAYPRDTELSSIEWDSPQCHSASTLCSGSSWQPLMQVVFQAGHGVAHPQPGTNCPTPAGNLRCDDPLGVSGGLAPPLVESTYVLNNLLVQVRTSGNGSWNTLHSYQFTYSQLPGSTQNYDPVTGLPMGSAGELNLTQFQEFGTDGQTSYPPQTFAYQNQTTNYLTEIYNTTNPVNLVALDRYFSSANPDDHWSTTGSVFSQNYVPEKTLGDIYTINYPAGTVPIYVCLSGTDHRLSLSSTCSGNGTQIDLDGYLYPGPNPPTQVTTEPLYRCLDSVPEYFESNDPNCEGQKVDKLLGYVVTAPQLDWLQDYTHDAPAGRWATSGTVSNSSGYSYLRTLGSVYFPSVNSNQPPGTIPMYGCEVTSNTVDRFLSLDYNCEGQTRMRLEGYLYPASNPPSSGGLSLYRCFNTTLGVHFESTDPNCEGQQVSGGLLGYIESIPALNQCGSTWNASNCSLWSQVSHPYLATADNGMGLQEQFTWAEAHNNTHGANQGDNLNDPLVCNAHRGSGKCPLADDAAWSRIVLTQRVATTHDVTGGVQASTWSYFYSLATLSAVPCTGCTQGMYWGDLNDSDHLDFYNTQFKGFAATWINMPDNTAELHDYFTTEGIGTYTSTPPDGCRNPYSGSCPVSAAWDTNNALSGMEIETDIYNPYNNGIWPLMRQTHMNYTASCPAVIMASPSVDTRILTIMLSARSIAITRSPTVLCWCRRPKPIWRMV